MNMALCSLMGVGMAQIFGWCYPIYVCPALNWYGCHGQLYRWLDNH